MTTVVFILHVLVVAVHFWSHVHHFKLYLSSLSQTTRVSDLARTAKRAEAMQRVGRPCYLLGQDGHSFLVFGVSQIDAVNSEDGISNVETSTSICRLTRMDL